METGMETKRLIAKIASIREQANTLIETELRARGIQGVVPAHGSILAFLYRQSGPVPMKAVIEHVGRVKSTVTGIVATLERHGYATRTKSAEDGRVVLVELTDKARAFLPQFQDISATLLDAAYGGMPREERETLMRLLDTVDDNLRTALAP